MKNKKVKRESNNERKKIKINKQLGDGESGGKKNVKNRDNN